MTVKKKILFVVPVVLLLALCVAPVMAVHTINWQTMTTPYELDLGTNPTDYEVSINFFKAVFVSQGYNIYRDAGVYGFSHDGTMTISQNIFYGRDSAGVSQVPYETFTLSPYTEGLNEFVFQKDGENYLVKVVYTYTGPEPTPGPVNPYISVTELYSDNLGTVYRFQCLPSGDTIRYSNIVPYIIPAYMAPAYAGELTSSQTSIEYRVPAGGTSEFSAVYATAPLTVGVISTTVTAPALTPAENQTYNPIPDPAQKPLTPFTSGKFQPTLTSGQVDVISKSPYVALLSNLNQSMQLPIMESPDSIRNKLVPDDLENITGPLYDTAAGWAEFTNFIPRLIADTMIGVYSPFLSAIADCKSVLLSFTGQLAELMKPVYILSPVFYLFIPDLVWIGVCLVLVLLIIHALLVFVLGEDTVVYFMGRDTIVADAIPDFPALEK